MKCSKVLRRWGVLFGVVLASAVLAGCHTGSKKKSAFSEVQLTPATGTNSAAASTALQATGGVGTLPPLSATTIRVGDALNVVFSDIPQPGAPPFDVRVQDDGTITLLQNKSFICTNKSVGELEREIRSVYVPAYYKYMTVTVRHPEATRFYYVDGEVKAPGRQVYTGPIKLLAAIASCGDFNDFANKKKVKLTRADGTTAVINCKKALEDPRLDLDVYPSDRIHVPRRWF
jgi:polysaccharide export outer membrane protein